MGEAMISFLRIWRDVGFGGDEIDCHGGLMGCPRDDLAPLMAWMEERSREKARRQHSQHRVVL